MPVLVFERPSFLCCLDNLSGNQLLNLKHIPKAVCNIMLMSFVSANLTWGGLHAVGINIILYTIFTY